MSNNSDIRYHIDTDMGVDDGLAIIFANHLVGDRLHAISIVFGNVPIEVATKNALIFSQLINPSKKLKIFQGASRACDNFFKSVAHVHGDDGFCGATKKYQKLFPDDNDPKCDVKKST